MDELDRIRNALLAVTVAAIALWLVGEWLQTLDLLTDASLWLLSRPEYWCCSTGLIPLELAVFGSPQTENQPINCELDGAPHLNYRFTNFKAKRRHTSSKVIHWSSAGRSCERISATVIIVILSYPNDP